MTGGPHADRWSGERHPGDSELVLERALGGELNPFAWLARAVSSSATRVLDLACATGVLSRRLATPGRYIVGVDLAGANVAAATRLGGGEFVQADMRYLPFASGSFDAVVSSLGLGVVADRSQLLAEVARVLRPGGVFAALTPSLRPLGRSDLRILGRLAVHLHVAPQLPGYSEFRAKQSLAEVGMMKVEDSRARYHFTIADEADAEVFLSGLRDASDRARASAAEFLADRVAGKGPLNMPLPMRRIVALK